MIRHDAKTGEILTAKQVMKILDISRNTFDRLRKERVIKVYRLGRKLYCKHSELLQALESQEE
ncbi:MAG: helix-turn-helix domain-containing protein [Phaeodactylibacter sp.]|nr:helix-turn-helix domain-containing protein [Phaeodactylibacter sp.]